MSVVLRCPNCGTTRSTPGECAACNEANVRYFCTNHTPGIWLDAPRCSACGDTFGASPSASPSSASATPIPAPAPGPPFAGRSSHAPVSTSVWPRTSVETPSRRAPPPTSDDEEPLAEVGIPAWQQILGALLRARYAATAAPSYRRPSYAGRGAGGCLRRLVLLVLVLLVVLVVALFAFGRAVMHGLQLF